MLDSITIIPLTIPIQLANSIPHPLILLTELVPPYTIAMSIQQAGSTVDSLLSERNLHPKLSRRSTSLVQNVAEEIPARSDWAISSQNVNPLWIELGRINSKDAVKVCTIIIGQ